MLQASLLYKSANCYYCSLHRNVAEYAEDAEDADNDMYPKKRQSERICVSDLVAPWLKGMLYSYTCIFADGYC